MNPVDWLLSAITLPAVLWTTGAWYFDVGKRGHIGWVLVFAWFAIVGLTLLSLQPLSIGLAAILVWVLLFHAWWIRQKPSHDRNWDPCFAVLPSIEWRAEDEAVDETFVVRNLRFARYPSAGEFSVHFEDRTYSLDEVQAVDALIIYWGSPWICHPVAIFDFGNDNHLCFSIEVRYRVGDQYAVLPSIYRQHELMYVVCDERDAILRRTRYFQEQIDCYLYRLTTGADFAKQLLKEYITATNRIATQPQWYNAVTSNCTTEIFENRQDKVPWDWRMLINGKFDKMLYDNQMLLNDRPFEELKKQSLINDVANRAGFENFSAEIRSELPGFKNPRN